MNAPATVRLTAAGLADLARGAAVALLGLLLSIVAILGWRRAAGAIVVPLDPARLLLTALLVATCAAGARFAWLGAAGRQAVWPGRTGILARRRSTNIPASTARAVSRVELALAALVSSVVLAIGLLVCLPGTTLAGRLALWIALAAEELFTWRLLIGRRPRGAVDAAAGLSASTRPDQSLPSGVPGKEVLQQLTRSRTADGGELLSGWLRVDLAAGQRTANLHVAFCPPFAQVPHISVQQIDGPEARIKAVQTLPHGVRFDLKVADEGPQASTLLLQFAASASPDS